ncbi:MAG: Rieske 2Fe-2S domain-containing protein [Candidatus Kapabacteria bacterium]|nr:Rieske 2Fe-2S domain-containing protein [Candidatus Kapabacteria bacterium]
MDPKASRRFFLHKAAASIGLAISAPAIAMLVSACERDEVTPKPPTGTTVTFDVTTAPELAIVGGITLTFVEGLNGGSPVFISRIALNTFAVFSSVCTHAACEVSLPSAPGENCICGCHRSMFSSKDGSVVQQPITGRATDLPRFASTFNSTTNILTITA